MKRFPVILANMLAIATFAVVSVACDEKENETPATVEVTSVTVTPATLALTVGDKDTLTAAVAPENATDKTVTWSSSAPTIAEVNASTGEVTAKGAGSATITAATANGKTAKCEVTVEGEGVAVTSVAVAPATIDIVAGGKRTLSATVAPENATDKTVTWSSSAPTIAEVDASTGEVTAKATGTATITATAGDNKTGSCEVTVKDSLVGVWTFEDSNNSLKATTGNDLTASGNYTVIEGPGATKAVDPGDNTYFAISHGINAGGNVNEYTLMMDILGTQDEFNNWLSVFNTQAGNSGEGVLWIAGDGAIGYEALGGYSSVKLNADTWHRVVLAAKLDESSFKIYIDGVPAFTANSNHSILALQPDALYIGADGTGYRGPRFAEVRIWNVQLTDAQINELGSPN